MEKIETRRGDVYIETDNDYIETDNDRVSVEQPYYAYTAGPMTGLPNYNYDTFHEVAGHVRLNGLPGRDPELPLIVINPAKNFAGDQTLPRRRYLALAVEQVAGCDGIVLLPEWHKSEGAQLEATIALNKGLDFYVALQIKGAWVIHPTSPSTVQNVLHALSDGQDTEHVKHPVEPSTIEDKASYLVRKGPRQQTYGHPRGDFDRVGLMWQAILGVPVSAEQVAVMMIAFKLARLSQTPQHQDSKIDVIGYTICLDRLQELNSLEYAVYSQFPEEFEADGQSLTA